MFLVIKGDLSSEHNQDISYDVTMWYLNAL